MIKEPDDAWRMTDALHAEHGKGDPFAAAIRATRMSMLITDPRQEDNPIVFANDAFLRLTGYTRGEVLGRNCRFLQGAETSAEDISKVRDAVANHRDIKIDLLNYRKDGSTFWNALYMSPVSNEAGDLLFFFASQLDVTDRKEAADRVHAEKERVEAAVKSRTNELEEALEAQKALLHEVDHRVKNNLQMISSLVLMQSRTIPDEGIRKTLHTMLERIEALSTVHRRLYQSEDVRTFDVADFIRDIVGELVGASGYQQLRSELELEPLKVPAQKAAPVALILNELLTNALKHGFNGTDEGTLRVRAANVDGQYVFEVADDGPGMSGEPESKSFGMRLIRSLGRQLDADVAWQDAHPGTLVTLKMPEPGEDPSLEK